MSDIFDLARQLVNSSPKDGKVSVNLNSDGHFSLFLHHKECKEGAELVSLNPQTAEEELETAIRKILCKEA